MKKTHEDFINEYYVSDYEGCPITFIKNKFNGEINVNADDLIKALGFEGSFEDFLGTDEGLDMISQWKKEHPDIPFFGGAVKGSDIDKHN